jgi:hypothetical protein
MKKIYRYLIKKHTSKHTHLQPVPKLLTHLLSSCLSFGIAQVHSGFATFRAGQQLQGPLHGENQERNAGQKSEQSDFPHVRSDHHPDEQYPNHNQQKGRKSTQDGSRGLSFHGD